MTLDIVLSNYSCQFQDSFADALLKNWNCILMPTINLEHFVMTFGAIIS